MSPHQVMAYLKTARFVAERVLPDAPPKQGKLTRVIFMEVRILQLEEVGIIAMDKTMFSQDFVPTGVIYIRLIQKAMSNLLSILWRYRIEVKARSDNSKEGEVIGINLGDGRPN